MSLIWRKQTQPSEGDLEPSFELYDTINGLGILHVLIASKLCVAFLFVLGGSIREPS